ncbi:MoaD/ThiS family protein [Loigolactobacillus iwatensis]|uniref:MoaD/ThiS family protein n=1 Tax=Loigolactobacillus iwatensis TaxID=1267156 RepID=UPI001CDC8326|nr:MoaD/ThiS family protein [Loigolactobacillus iwatensis]
MEVKLFAILAEQLGDQVHLKVSEPITADKIKQAMVAQFPQTMGVIKDSMVAVNQTFVTTEQFQAQQVNEIALIPPVSGG